MLQLLEQKHSQLGYINEQRNRDVSTDTKCGTYRKPNIRLRTSTAYAQLTPSSGKSYVPGMAFSHPERSL